VIGVLPLRIIGTFVAILSTNTGYRDAVTLSEAQQGYGG
jgi:hypothetical protein